MVALTCPDTLYVELPRIFSESLGNALSIKGMEETYRESLVIIWTFDLHYTCKLDLEPKLMSI